METKNQNTDRKSWLIEEIENIIEQKYDGGLKKLDKLKIEEIENPVFIEEYKIYVYLDESVGMRVLTGINSLSGVFVHSIHSRERTVMINCHFRRNKKEE